MIGPATWRTNTASGAAINYATWRISLPDGAAYGDADTECPAFRQDRRRDPERALRSVPPSRCGDFPCAPHHRTGARGGLQYRRLCAHRSRRRRVGEVGRRAAGRNLPGPAGDPPVTSREALKDYLRSEPRVFTDAREWIELLVAEDDKVAALMTFSGTQRGPMGPLPPGRVLKGPLPLHLSAAVRADRRSLRGVGQSERADRVGSLPAAGLIEGRFAA